MAITLDEIRSYYNPSLVSEAESALGPQEEREKRWDQEMGIPSRSQVPFPMEATTPTQPPVTNRRITIKEDVQPSGQVMLPQQLPATEPKTGGLLKPTGNVLLDPMKGFAAGVAQATAGEIDTVDWLINKIADAIPGVPRQEIIGKLRDVITPEALDKDEETLTYTIGNAVGYGATQMALLYALIFKPLKAAKILNAVRIKDVTKLATKAGRAKIGFQGALRAAEPGGEAWLKAIKAGKFGARPGLASRAIDTLGNVGLAGPVGLGIHGAITGAKVEEQTKEAQALEEGREIPDSERLRANIDGAMRGGTQGFMMGTVLGLMHNWSQLKRTAGMGTVFGGMSLAEGSDVKRGFADFITGALLGYMPNKPGEKWPWSRAKGEKIAPADASKPAVDTGVIEDLVTVSQAAQIDPRVARGWAKAAGYTDQEAVVRIREMQEVYGGPGADKIHPYVDPSLGVVFKRGSTKGEGLAEKTWEQIRKKHKNHLEAALEFDKWAKNWISSQGIEPNPVLTGHMDNLVHTLTRDSNGYSPVGSAYISPASAFKGTHTTNWAGQIYREIFKATKAGDLSPWKAVMSDGREVELADSPGSRQSRDGKFLYSNTGEELPIRDVKIIVSTATDKPILTMPEKTAKDILQERRVAEKADALAQKQAETSKAKAAAEEKQQVAAQRKLDAEKRKEIITENKRRQQTGEELLEVPGEEVYKEVSVGDAEWRNNFIKELDKQIPSKMRKEAATRLGITEEEFIGILANEVQGIQTIGKRSWGEKQVEPREEFLKNLDRTIPVDVRKRLARKLGITEGELIARLEFEVQSLQKTGVTSGKLEWGKGKQEIAKETTKALRAPYRAKGTSAEEFLGRLYGKKPGVTASDIELMGRQVAEAELIKERKAISAFVAAEARTRGVSEAKEEARLRKGTEFKRYGLQEPRSKEYYAKEKTAAGRMAPEKEMNLKATAQALGMSVKELQKMLDNMDVGPPRITDPKLIPYTLEKFLGFTPEQARLLAEYPVLAELILDGPSVSSMLRTIRGRIAEAERDPDLTEIGRKQKLTALRAEEARIPEEERKPFSSKDIYVDDLGRIKPLSSRAEKFFNGLMDSLQKQIPDLEWPRIEWLGKITGKLEGKARRTVDMFSLNDLVHALRMDTEFTKLKYHQDVVDSPGVSHLPKAEQYLLKPAQLFATHKFHNAIFGPPEQIRRTLAGIARSEGMRLSDKQLDVAANWITMQNEARGINTKTGQLYEVEEARDKFTRKGGRVPKSQPITTKDIEFFFNQDRTKEWGEAADIATELTKVGVLPSEYKDRVEMLKSSVSELESSLSAFGLKFTNLRERVQLVNRVKDIADRIVSIRNSDKIPEAQKAIRIARLTKLAEKIKDNKLTPLRRVGLQDSYNKLREQHMVRMARVDKDTTMDEITKAATKVDLNAKYDDAVKKLDKGRATEALAEESIWGPLRKGTYQGGKLVEEGEVESFMRLASRMSDAYKALDNVRYQENPINWEPNERRLLSTPDGEPIIISTGTSRIPGLGPLQQASLQASLRRAGKKYYVSEEHGFTSGISTVIGIMEEVAPGMKMPISGGMIGDYTMDIAKGTSPEARRIRKEMIDEAIKGAKLSPEEQNAAREYYFNEERNRLMTEAAEQAAMSKEDYEMAMDLQRGQVDYPWLESEDIVAMETERGARTAGAASEFGKLGVTPRGTTWQILKEMGLTSEQRKERAKLSGEADKILRADRKFQEEQEALARNEELGISLIEYPSGKLEHPKVAGAKEETLTRARVALEPVTVVENGKDVVRPGQFRVILFQEALTKVERDKKSEAIRILKEELKTADRKPVSYPIEEALKKFPWLEREEKQPGSPQKTQVRIRDIKDKIELVRETGEGKERVREKAVYFEETPYTTRQYEPGYRVSDRHVILHDIRRLQAELIGTTLLTPKGKFPVIFDGQLTYTEVSTEKGKSNKLVWKFAWQRPGEEVLKVGDPRELQLARSAELVVKDYLRNRAPLPYSGEARETNIEYEFADTPRPTILEHRGTKAKQLREEYREKYGIDYSEKPITEKHVKMPVFKGKSDEILRYRDDTIKMAKSEQREERRLAARIADFERAEKVIEGKYRTTEFEKKLYAATGRTYEPVENVFTRGGIAHTGETPAELKWKKRPLTTKREAQIGVTVEERVNLASRMVGALGVESPVQQATRLEQEYKKFKQTAKYKLQQRDKEGKITGKTKEVSISALENDPQKQVDLFRAEFARELDTLPVDVREALIAYQREKFNFSVLDLGTLPSTISALKGMITKTPAKESTARKLMKEQLDRRLNVIENVGKIYDHLNNVMKEYERNYDLVVNGTPEESAGAGTVIAGTLRTLKQLMEMIRNQRVLNVPEKGTRSIPSRYASDSMGVEGIMIQQVKAWLKGFEDAREKFEKKIGEEKFGISDGLIVDLTKGPATLTPEGAGVEGLPGEQKGLAKPIGEAAQRIGEFSGIEGLPGEHRFLKRPTKDGEAGERERLKNIAMVGGKKIILPGASSKEVERALKQGAKMSKEAQTMPSMRNKQREAEYRIALTQSRDAPPVKVTPVDTGRVAKKVILQPLTQQDVLVAIKMMEDFKRSPFYISEEDRIKLYNRNPVISRNWFRGIFENFGQFSQSSIPEFRVLAQGADLERMSKINTLKQLIYNEDSPMKRIRALAGKIKGVKSGDEGLELTSEYAMYKRIPEDPNMKEILRIAREELAPGFKEAAHMVDVGVDIAGYNFPLIVDMNRTFERIKGRYGHLGHNELHKVRGGDTIQAMTNQKEWAEIRDIFDKKDYWNQSSKTPYDSSRILTDREKDMMRVSILQFTNALDDMRYLPGEVKSQLRLKDSFNKHLQHRTEGKDFLSYKHNFAESWENYIYNMAQVNYINNVKKLAAPLLNVYGDRDVAWTPGWQMERYMRRIFGSWESQEKWLARKAQGLNEMTGREIINPAFLAKGVPSIATGRVVQGAIGMIDSSIRQLSDHAKMLVADEAWGKTYVKTWFEGVKNWAFSPEHKFLGEYYKWWDTMAIGRESFEGATGETRSLGERLAKKATIPRKMYTLYDWIGEKGLGLFTMMEHFNKGFGLLFNINRMKAKGASWDEAVQVGIHNASTNVSTMYVPKPIHDAYREMLNQNIGYSQEHRSMVLGLNPLMRLSTIFFSYPGDMARFLYQGTKDGWHKGRQYGEWGQLARFSAYLGFQLSIASALGSTLGIDVGSTFGVGLLPVKALSVPWEILYNSYKGIDPMQYVGKPQFQEDERQKALSGLTNALGILFVPQYRWGSQQIKNLQSLNDGFKENIQGRDVMEWSVPRALMTFLAAPPIENSETWDLVMELDDLTKKQRAQKRQLVKEGIEAIKDRNYGALAAVKRKAVKKGVPLSYEDIYTSHKDLQELSVLEKAFKQAPPNIRAQYKTKMEDLKARSFPGGDVVRKIKQQQRNLWSRTTSPGEAEEE